MTVMMNDMGDRWPGQIWPNVRQTTPVGYRVSGLCYLRQAGQH